MLDALLTRFREKDRQALSRLLTLLARGEEVEAIRAAVPHRASKSKVVALTGSGGVGKSTLVGRLVEHVRSRGQSVAVLACDPQSPLTGGALLGDRARMPLRPDDDGVLVRSLAVESGEQAVARRLELMLDVLAEFGFDIVLVETVGAGQGDTLVRELADVVVLLVQPESGDELQWEKAGLLEVADLVVVHKSDLPRAPHTAAQLEQLLNLPGCRPVPVLQASAAKGQGIAELWSAVEQQFAGIRPARRRDAAGLSRLVQQLLGQRLAEHPELLEAVVARWQAGQLDDAAAAEAVLHELCSVT